MDEIIVFALVLAPIVSGVVEVVKRSFKFPKGFIPLVAILLGIGIGAVATPLGDLELLTRLWAGGLAGIASVGFYELVTPSKGMTKEG